MRHLTKHGAVAFAIALTAGLGLTVGEAAAQQEEEQEQNEERQEEELCRASLAPASIVRQEEPVAVQVAFAEDVGTTTEVEAQERSGLEVIKVEKAVEVEKTAAETAEAEKAEGEGEAEYEAAAREPAYDVLIRLDAREAQSGEWELRFEGTEGACVGEVQVTLPAEAEGETPSEEEGSGEPPRS